MPLANHHTVEQAAVERMVSTGMKAWNQACALPRHPLVDDVRFEAFKELLGTIDSSAMKSILSAEERNRLQDIFSTKGSLNNLSVAVYGAGTFGLTLAMALTEADAKVTIYTSDEEIQSIQAKPGYDMTFSALGLGRSAVQGEQNIDMPGNRGQIICVEGAGVASLLKDYAPLKDVGAIGIPSSTGSVNIVVHYADPLTRQIPVLIIGATKKPGSAVQKPSKDDYEFLMNGIERLWPELHNGLVNGDSASCPLNATTYVCVRPGGGTSAFAINESSGCIDISCAGGTGNTIALAAALKAMAMGLGLLAESR